VYVMLSRAVSWENVAILRPFDAEIFCKLPDEKLEKYDAYLEEMNSETREKYENKMSREKERVN
jgi:hypothetical protein